MCCKFGTVSRCWIFAAFVPLIKNLPPVLTTGQSASGILSDVMKRRFFEVRLEDAQEIV